MRSANERLGLAVLLLIFCTVAGIFTWNSWQLKNEVLSLRTKTSDQAKLIGDLRAEIESARIETTEDRERTEPDTIQTSLSAPVLRQKIEEKNEQISRLEDEALRAAEIANSEIEITRLTPLVEAQERVLRNLDYQIRSLEEQFTVFDVRERTLKEQRLRAWEDEQRAITQRLQEIEQSIPALQAQIVEIQGRWPAPGWRVGLQIQNLQNSISEQRRETVTLTDRRRQIERESIDRRNLPEPDIAIARANVRQSLQELQEKRAEEARRLGELRAQVEQVERRRSAAEEATLRASEERSRARQELLNLQAALQQETGAELVAE